MDLDKIPSQKKTKKLADWPSCWFLLVLVWFLMYTKSIHLILKLYLSCMICNDQIKNPKFEQQFSNACK